MDERNDTHVHPTVNQSDEKKPKSCDKARTFARTTMLHLSYVADVGEGLDAVEKLALRAVSEE